MEVGATGVVSKSGFNPAAHIGPNLVEESVTMRWVR